MANFLGEYECKLDSKSRILLPAALKKQFPPEAQECFVINRGFEKHLVLYPRNVWDRISAQINGLNFFVEKNRKFARYFYRGATELRLDGQGRLLLPKRLLAYAGIDEDIVMLAYHDRIEVWAGAVYNQMIEEEPEDFAHLAEDIMGALKPSPTGDQ